MRPHTSLQATLTVEEVERLALEVRQALAAAKASGDVVLMDYDSEYLKNKLWTKTIKPRILRRDSRSDHAAAGC
ncbi:hypothetical protein [Achromobacter pestifer]|uniref:Uncharacterized protein n=1 Tax=Achromobacter pestifer TaxID=1353889 RepID=A0A6S6Z2Q8_9BURK|nr:hypothetical protein [Achromobacter pestifer]CAB3647356.1 hypothetical protein LMG3431_02561 [Achromobacter pestifer]